MKDAAASARTTQWVACIAAIMSAICAGFSGYVAWKNSKYVELTVRPRLTFDNVVLHRYPSKTLLEVSGLKNCGSGDAQKGVVTLFIRKNWLRGAFWRSELHRLDKGDEHGSIFFNLGKTVTTSDGEVVPCDYFKTNGILLSVEYEDTWTREKHSENWQCTSWTIEDHGNE